MTIGLVIGALTAAVSGAMAASVLNRYRRKGGAHHLMWGLGLTLYFVAGLSEVILAFGWSSLAFRVWYWSGAIMVPAVLGQGTLHLLSRRRRLAAVLSAAVGLAGLASLAWALTIPLDASRFTSSVDVARFLTESYRAILPDSAVRRVLPVVMNSYGTLLLAGGAVASAILAARRQMPRNRVAGNVLVAAGGLLPALGGTLVKLAESVPGLSEVGAAMKYLGILGGVVLLYAGFRLAASGAAKPVAGAGPVPVR